MSNVNTPDVLAHSMAESLMRDNQALRAEVASLKEERDRAIRQNDIDWVRRQEITRLTQQLAAANGRVEMIKAALTEYSSQTNPSGVCTVTTKYADAALSNLNEDRAG